MHHFVFQEERRFLIDFMDREILNVKFRDFPDKVVR